MRLIVTGTQGQVARALAERGPVAGVEVRLVGRPEFDLADPAGVARALEGVDGDVVVNAAAYTAVDKAESEPDLAMRVNAEGAGAVAAAAFARGLPLLHLSTDYVFDGALDRPYREDDATAPTGAYGRSKLEGERAVERAHPGALILRTSWVYAPFGANFLRTMLRLGETREEVGVVADQRGVPTYAPDIADALIAVARTTGPARGAAPPGVYNLVASGEATWADFAEAIFAEAAAYGRPQVRVKRIATVDYPTPAKRPANSRLDPGKLARTFGLRLPDWRASTRECAARLLGPA